MKITRTEFENAYARFRQRSDFWCVPAGVFLGVVAVIGLASVKWLVVGFQANAFVRALLLKAKTALPLLDVPDFYSAIGFIVIVMLVLMVAIVPVWFLFAGLGRAYGLACPECRCALFASGPLVMRTGKCPRCGSSVLEGVSFGEEETGAQQDDLVHASTAANEQSSTTGERL